MLHHYLAYSNMYGSIRYKQAFTAILPTAPYGHLGDWVGGFCYHFQREKRAGRRHPVLKRRGRDWSPAVLAPGLLSAPGRPDGSRLHLLPLSNQRWVLPRSEGNATPRATLPAHLRGLLC